jgi:pilus assembly protein Flp/PilA
MSAARMFSGRSYRLVRSLLSLKPERHRGKSMSMIKMLARLGKDEDGAALVEYTVLIGLITVAVIATVVKVGDWVSTEWVSLCSTLGTNCK